MAAARQGVSVPPLWRPPVAAPSLVSKVGDVPGRPPMAALRH